MKEEDEPLTLSNMKMILSLYTSLNKMSKSEEVESSYIKNRLKNSKKPILRNRKKNPKMLKQKKKPKKLKKRTQKRTR